MHQDQIRGKRAVIKSTSAPPRSQRIESVAWWGGGDKVIRSALRQGFKVGSETGLRLGQELPAGRLLAWYMALHLGTGTFAYDVVRETLPARVSTSGSCEYVLGHSDSPRVLLSSKMSHCGLASCVVRRISRTAVGLRRDQTR